MNGYQETSDDEEFAIACGYEIISEEEICESYDIISLSAGRHSTSVSPSDSSPYSPLHSKVFGKSLRSKPSVSSFFSTSTQFSGVSSIMTKPMSSCSLSTQSGEMSEDDCYVSMGDPHDTDLDNDLHLSLSVDRMWYMIQQKRHHHDTDEGIQVDHILTMEPTSNNKKIAAWLHNIVHFPEKIRQIVANKHRFNIDKAPEQIRDELKHIYVY